MRRIAFLLAVSVLLAGCASTDRFSYGRQDPLIWFLSGMPAPYDLNWPRDAVPDLPVLNPPDYTPIAPLQPLDYPRGWNPDNPPLISPDAGIPSATPDAVDAQPQPATPCSGACSMPASAPLPDADGSGDVAGDAARESRTQR